MPCTATGARVVANAGDRGVTVDAIAAGAQVVAAGAAVLVVVIIEKWLPRRTGKLAARGRRRYAGAPMTTPRAGPRR